MWMLGSQSVRRKAHDKEAPTSTQRGEGMEEMDMDKIEEMAALEEMCTPICVYECHH